MNIFQINKAIEEAIDKAIDVETGEILDFSELEELQLAKEEKIKNTALYVLNLRAEAKAVEEQEQKFKKRKNVLINKEKNLSEKIQFILNGETFNSPEVDISYHKSKAVVITDEQAFKDFEYNPNYVKITTEINPDKIAIRQAIERGEVIPGCEIVEKQNMQIK